ncbi:MAG: ankyrin repeat domain-containing protein [Candidatus Binatia bacterium]
MRHVVEKAVANTSDAVVDSGVRSSRRLRFRSGSAAWTLALFSLVFADRCAAAPEPPTMSLRDAVDSANVDQVERYSYWCRKEKNCSFSYEGLYGGTVLHVAARAGDVRIVRLLLDAGADVEACSSGMSPLAEASGAGKTDVVVELLRRGANADGKCTGGSEFPLRIAANAAVARELIRAGASIDKSGRTGETALYSAAEWRRTDVVAVLLEHGAAVEPPGGTVEPRSAGDPRGPAVSALHRAIMGTDGDPAGTVTLLLEAGADPNRRFDHLTRGAHGQTALLEAVTRDEVEIARLLVKAGADVNVSSAEGRTPIVVATSPEMVEVLLAAGAVVGGQDTDGETALHHAASATNRASAVYFSTSHRPEDVEWRRQAFARQTESLRQLLAAGADVSLRNRDGATPLHAAARAGNVPAIELLLQRKADVRATDAKGATPLHYAAEGGSVEATDLLLKAGADVNALTADGESPSSWARRHLLFTSDGHARVLELLREQGETVLAAPKAAPSVTGKRSNAATHPAGSRIIDKSSAARVASSLGPSHSWILERGATLKLGEYRRASLPAAFAQATETYSARVYQQGWTLKNYVAGLPIPTIDLTHPQAGRHLIWNVEAAASVDDLHITQVECDTAAIGTNANGIVVERNFKSRGMYRLGFAGRWQAEPKPLLEPNRDAVRFKEVVFGLVEPMDQRGNGWASFRYLADDKPMDTWLYLAQLRRVRRLPPAQRSEPLLGQDIDADSVAGFAAPAESFEWRILGERTILSPFHADDSPAEWSAPPWNYLPDTPWEPRKVWELEGTPKDAAYAYSKRLLYVDQETYRIVASNLYDRRGELSKFWTSGWKFDEPSAGSSFATFVTMIDMQLGHATWCTFPPASGWYVNTGASEECLFELSHPMGADPCPSLESPMRSRQWP